VLRLRFTAASPSRKEILPNERQAGWPTAAPNMAALRKIPALIRRSSPSSPSVVGQFVVLSWFLMMAVLLLVIELG
jgi:hypothetical protein